MTQETWSSVDDYIVDALGLGDPALAAAQAAADAAGLPPIQVSTAQGKFLEIVAKAIRARRILEIGTLGGFSTICLARALPADGRLMTMEIDPKHADVARINVANAGLADRVEIRVGNALDLLPILEAEHGEAFDLTFIDADKVSNPTYFEWGLRMSRPGSLIIVDNVVREGAVTDSASSDPSVQGVRRLNEVMAADTRLTATVIQTVGTKGYDGFSVALVNSNLS